MEKDARDGQVGGDDVRLSAGGKVPHLCGLLASRRKDAKTNSLVTKKTNRNTDNMKERRNTIP